MHTFWQIMGIALAVFVIGWFFYQQIRLNYNRNWRSYEKEIRKYLETDKLEYMSHDRPTDEEWQDSPFEKPPRIKFSLVMFQVNGVNSSFSHEKYRLIKAKDSKGKLREIWLEIHTAYFFSPQLNFKDPAKKRKIPVGPHTATVGIKGKCPACGHPVQSTDSDCPDCGLHFV